MNPIYRFYLEINDVKQLAHPLYGSDLIKSYSREARQMFFREQFKGKLRFVKSDYAFIMSSAFDSVIYVYVEKSNDGGISWSRYLKGKFTRTDCTISVDDRVLETELIPIDNYENLLAGLDKEFNLIELAPEIKPVSITKRPAVQIYVTDTDVVTTFVGNLYFEQASTGRYTDTDMSKFHFRLQRKVTYISIFSYDSGVVGEYTGYYIKIDDITFLNPDLMVRITIKENGRIEVWKSSNPHGIFDTVVTTAGSINELEAGGRYFKFEAQDSTGAIIKYMSTSIDEGKVYASIYARLLCDSDSGAYTIPIEDIVDSNSNYKKCTPIYIDHAIEVANSLSTEPTEWGIYQPGQYYKRPKTLQSVNYYPIGRSAWGRFSLWFTPLNIDSEFANYEKAYTLWHTYPLYSCIAVLLKKVAPELAHDSNDSQFFYSTANPISGDSFKVLITQNTNILKGGYDQPAQKALVTLGQILNMLRDCFQCYCYVEGNHLKIEHRSFFQKGLSYEKPSVGMDLTSLVNRRTNLPIDYGLSKYSFIKEDMPEWYQFSWADDVSIPFKGHPIEMLSNYIEKGNIKDVRVNNFVSDVDLMLLNPGAFSEEGLTLLMATSTDDSLKLPIVPKTILSETFKLQNGYAAFCDLQEKYYKNSLPAKRVKLNKTEITVLPTPNRKQEVRVPAPIDDPDVYKLIRTSLGDGQISDIEINLSSRIAKITLLHDTE